MARLREHVKHGALARLKKDPGRNPKDEKKGALKTEVARLKNAFKEVSIENAVQQRAWLSLTAVIRGDPTRRRRDPGSQSACSEAGCVDERAGGG